MRLQEARYKILKDLYKEKYQKDEVLFYKQEAEEQKCVDVDLILQLQQNSDVGIEKLKTCLDIEKSGNKPVQKIFSHLKDLAPSPFLPSEMKAVLERWYLAAQWHSKGCLFLRDKLRENFKF